MTLWHPWGAVVPLRLGVGLLMLAGGVGRGRRQLYCRAIWELAFKVPGLASVGVASC